MKLMRASDDFGEALLRGINPAVDHHWSRKVQLSLVPKSFHSMKDDTTVESHRKFFAKA
jgi:hypothetical protein